jgi:hypothetical protein
MTVSNLSQAIRFLVQNDFLRDVEIEPGEASRRGLVEVVRVDDKGEDDKSFIR